MTDEEDPAYRLTDVARRYRHLAAIAVADAPFTGPEVQQEIVDALQEITQLRDEITQLADALDAANDELEMRDE